MGEGHFLKGKPEGLREEKWGMDAGKSINNVQFISEGKCEKPLLKVVRRHACAGEGL